MLRRSVFALMLVGAAFAGGAAINGPGLAWLRKAVLGGPTIIVDGPSAADPSASRKAPKPFPTAKAEPLAVVLPRPPEPARLGPPAATPPAELDPLLPPESPPTPASALSRPADLPGADLLPPPGPAPARDAPADPVARLASAEAPPAPTPSPTAARDWAEIRKRLRALGVARYSIEAETDGRVRFTCVIPVDGLRAVGHHFEAEGDDEYQAAEAALRRVALWQATESK